MADITKNGREDLIKKIVEDINSRPLVPLPSAA